MHSQVMLVKRWSLLEELYLTIGRSNEKEVVGSGPCSQVGLWSDGLYLKVLLYLPNTGSLQQGITCVKNSDIHEFGIWQHFALTSR